MDQPAENSLLLTLLGHWLIIMYFAWEMEESQRQAYHSKHDEATTIMGMVSHELRTPVYAINEIVGNLLQQDDTLTMAQVRPKVETIAAACMNVNIMIKDLLLAASFYNRQEVLIDKHNVNISECMERSIAMVQHKLRDNITIDLDIQQTLPKVVVTDGARISQVVTNLLTNATKFTEQGSIRLTCTAVSSDLNANVSILKVAVQDTGIGISEVDSHNLRRFQVFNKVRSARSDALDVTGTGLGLVICHRLAKILGGDFGFSSKVSVGSTFWFTFAVGLIADEDAKDSAGTRCCVSVRAGSDDKPDRFDHRTRHAPVIQTAVRAASPTSFAAPLSNSKVYIVCKSKIKLLVADDSILIQRVVSYMFEGSDVQITEALDGEHALKLVAANQFDCIIMDCNMPRIDGLECARRIRRQEEANGLTGDSRTPIIGHTAHIRRAYARQCTEAGMDDLFTKPCKRHTMLSGIAALTKTRLGARLETRGPSQLMKVGKGQ
jgi:signal transduction histidine kinase/FixJ family two-component response regulator